jgi:glycerol-3-phosphate responsive antiterminator
MRNALKRRARLKFIELDIVSGSQNKRQLFFFVNKNSLEEMKQLIATKNKKRIYEQRNSFCAKDFIYVLRQL